MDYSGAGISALVGATVLGLALGFLSAGIRLAVSHMTSRKGVNLP